jgi:multiple sugar transport system substrate-binding protein
VISGLRGLTWDHPRGYVVLDALNAGPVRWERQSLEGFESRPLRDLADDFDLLIIDHPALGEAVRDHALRPLNEVLSEAELSACEAVSAGRSYASYGLAGSQWALPVDAAAQVSVTRPDLMADRTATWDEAREAARRHRTAVCLGGPHALLMFAAICVSLGAPPASPESARADRAFTDHSAGSQALDIMADLLAHADPGLARRNPIAVLDAMAAGDGPAYCPLVYGYISYQRPRDGQGQSPNDDRRYALTAFDAPAGAAGIGSVLGGTGIAVTRSCTRLDLAGAYIRYLISEETQVRRYAQLGGQSADRRAWLDRDADTQARGFYAATRRTVEAAWVRPRFAGYLDFQSEASAVLRDGLIDGQNHDRLLDRVDELFARSAQSIAPAQNGAYIRP